MQNNHFSRFARVLLSVLSMLIMDSPAFAEERMTVLPKGVETPRTVINEPSQDFCSLCACCSTVRVFDAKKLLENKAPVEIEALAVVVHQKYAADLKEIIAKHPTGPERNRALARITLDQVLRKDLCDVVPCKKNGKAPQVDWAKIKSQPRLIDSMQTKGFVVLPIANAR